MSGYAPLASLLPPSWTVAAIQSRALADASLEHTRLTEMAEAYATRVRAELPTTELVLFGWSLGAMAAHAVASHLEDGGRSVARVGMVDPVLGPAPPPAASVAAAMAVQIFEPSPLSSRARKELRALDAPGAPPAYELCRDRAFIGAQVERERFEAAMQLLPVHQALLRDFVPARCRAPVRVWRAAAFKRTSVLDLEALSRSAVEVSDVPATHYTIMDRPHLETIAAELVAMHGDDAG